MDMMTKIITQKACVTIVITNMAELKSHGTALMKNSMPVECAKIVTSTCTIKKNVKKLSFKTKKTSLHLTLVNFQLFY